MLIVSALPTGRVLPNCCLKTGTLSLYLLQLSCFLEDTNGHRLEHVSANASIMRLEQLKGWKWSHLSVVGTYNLVVMYGLIAPCQFRAISTITDPSLQRRFHSFVQRRDELEARSADVEKTCVSSQNELQAPLGAHRFFQPSPGCGRKTRLVLCPDGPISNEPSDS